MVCLVFCKAESGSSNFWGRLFLLVTFANSLYHSNWFSLTLSCELATLTGLDPFSEPLKSHTAEAWLLLESCVTVLMVFAACMTAGSAWGFANGVVTSASATVLLLLLLQSFVTAILLFFFFMNCHWEFWVGSGRFSWCFRYPFQLSGCFHCLLGICGFSLSVWFQLDGHYGLVLSASMWW